MLRLGLAFVASIGLHAEAQSPPARRPTDPRGIAAVIGLSTRDLDQARCTRRRSPLAPRGAIGVLSCLPALEAFPRLTKDDESWAIGADTLDHIYSGQRTWRLLAPMVAEVRDSLADAFDARGLKHLACPDSVHRPTAHSTRWLSVWRGPTYNVLLFHVRTDEAKLQLTVQVSPGLGQRCYEPP